MAGTSSKDAIRIAVGKARKLQSDKELASRKIIARLEAMPEYDASQTVLWYIDVRDEVRTRQALQRAMEKGKRVAVPYCDGNDLRLFHLRSWEDLSPGAFGILEPRQHLRLSDDRRIQPATLEFVVVPGIAFDTRGGRLGYGRGFYDRLLSEVDPNAVLVALAFECQVIAEVPMSDHDVWMDWLVTQRRTIHCKSDPRVHADTEHW